MPLTLSIERGGAGFRYKAMARRVVGSTLVNGALTLGTKVYTTFGQGALRAGWNTFVLELEPSFEGEGGVVRPKGLVRLWVNGTDVLRPTHEYRGSWGSNFPGVSAPDTFDLRVGAYLGTDPTQQTVFLDRVKYGTSFAAVLP